MKPLLETAARAPSNRSERPKKRWRWVFLLALSALSGVSLFFADYPFHLWPLGGVALIPFCCALHQWARTWLQAAAAGLFVGLCNVVPLAVYLDFPFLMGALLALYLVVLWALFGVAFHWVGRWPAPWGSLAAGAAMVLIEWVDFTLVPVWGTAQSFVRTWSAAPGAVQIVEWTGMLGLVFWVVATNAAMASVIVGAGRRRHSLIVVGVLVVCALAANWGLWRQTTERGPRVAAMGWTEADVDAPLYARPTKKVFYQLYLPLLHRALTDDVDLIVSPEVSFRLDPAHRRWLFERLSRLARKHKVALVVGYFDIRRNDNRMAFFAANGKWIGEYVKSHLIPVFEKYRAGSGRPTTVRFGRWKVGGLICQDDNFTDIARAYGRRAVSIIAVPTNDWAQVKHHHLENTIFRAVENRFAMVRAATNGISALISPRGRVLARVDHFAAGPAVITARMQLMPATTTLYAWAGDWLAAVCAVFLVMLIVVRRRKTARESSSADKDASTSRALCAKNLR